MAKTINRRPLINISFEVAGIRQLDRALGMLNKNVSDLSFVWPDLRDDFIANQKKQFDTQGRHGSGGWAALTPRYAAWKAKRFPNRKILVRYGNLKASLTKQADPDFVYKPGRLGLELGTKDPKARYHQLGTRDMKARPPVELTEAQKRRWPKLIQEAIIKSGQESVRQVL